jgi:predicted secreted Zn-dependent protease
LRACVRLYFLLAPALSLLLTALCPPLPAHAAAGWKPVETIATYAISGQSGEELYRSIGENGPLIRGARTRTIAYTNFKLTWVRDYQRRGEDCVLASARPKLTVTYTLPKPSAPLPPAVRRNWDTFIAGVTAHEKVHGEGMIRMVRDIEAATIGLTVADDPKCSKIRDEMVKRLDAISKARVEESREFDRVEFGEGGNLWNLVAALVTGP